MSINLSTAQSSVLDDVMRWYRSSDSQVYYLAGYAGTGKTTLARYVAEAVGEGVLFSAFTGKAAHAMMRRGVPHARTIHSLIYTPFDVNIEDKLAALQAELMSATVPLQVRKLQEEITALKESEHKPKFALNHESELKHAKLLILDECSMVDTKIGEDLVFFGTKILVLGDPAQLPPVRGAGYFTERKPDGFLTEIHRQAQDDPILHLATRVRQGNFSGVRYGEYGGTVTIVSKNDVKTSHIISAYDQVLCGYNKTRHAFNFRSRRVQGFAAPLPMEGERLIALKNDHQIGILNGMLMKSLSPASPVEDDPEALSIQVQPEGHDPMWLGCIKSRFTDVEIDPGMLKRRLMDVDYGYAITVHKSQGSEWESVCLLDDGFGRGQDRDRWLYTAVTRARSKLMVVR